MGPAHRGVYGIGGGGGMYKSRIAGFSFLVDPLAEPQGDWALIREELFWKVQHNNWTIIVTRYASHACLCMVYLFTDENKWSHFLLFLPSFYP